MSSTSSMWPVQTCWLAGSRGVSWSAVTIIGKAQLDRFTPTKRARDTECLTRLLHKTLEHRQTQASAGARAFRGEERFRGLRKGRVVHAGTDVRYSDPDPGLRRGAFPFEAEMRRLAKHIMPRLAAIRAA
jgi:hypothetical protein